MPGDPFPVSFSTQEVGLMNSRQWWMVLGASAALFFFGLLVTEMFGEIPPDVDFKPFFIPLVLLASLPWRYRWAVALGAAIGEGVGDLLEGYELADDPMGFIGYVLGFVVAAQILRDRPHQRSRLVAAGLAAAFINAVPEAIGFYLEGVEPWAAVLSALGNTFSHGVLLGAIPLVLLAPIARRTLARLVRIENGQGRDASA